TGNDIRENSAEMSQLPRPTFTLGDDGKLVQHDFKPAGERIGQWLLGRSALYAWQKAWAVTEKLLEKIRDTTAAANAKLVVIIIPDVVQVDDATWNAVVAQSP